MKVASGCNKKQYQQQKPNTAHQGKGFSDMYREMAAKKPVKPESEKGCCCCNTNHTEIGLLNLRVNGFWCCGTRIKLTAEQLAVVEEYDSGKIEFGRLEIYRQEDLPELVISSPPGGIASPSAPEPKYPESIWNLSPSEIKTELANAWAACSYINTTGMTNGEIYNRIESIYKDYLGKDFETQWNLYACVMNGGGPDSQGHGFFLAQSEFESQLIKFGVGRGNVEIVREARGYTDMSDDEMRAAVREKYPKNMTLKHCILMAQEMYRLGLTKGNVGYSVQDYLETSLGVNWSPPIYSQRSEADINVFNSAFKKLYTTMLDMPADFERMEALSNEHIEKGFTFYASGNIDDLLEKMLSAFGGGGLFSQEMIKAIREILEEMQEDGGLVLNTNEKEKKHEGNGRI